MLDWSEAENAGIEQEFVATHVVHSPPVLGGLERDPATARLLVMGGYLDEHLWDPLTGDFATDDALWLDADLFCSGHAITPEGNIFFAGGGGGNVSNALATAFRFERLVADSGKWNTLAPMTFQRWYPTVTALGDGRMLVFGGAVDGNCAAYNSVGFGACEAQPACDWVFGDPMPCQPDTEFEGTVRRTPEVYDFATNTWTTLEASEFTPPLYPFMFLLPDGNVFYAGGDGGASNQDQDTDLTDGRVLTLDGDNAAWSERVYPAGLGGGSAVMFRPGQVMKSGGGGVPTSRTVFIDLRPTDEDGNGLADYLESDRPWTELPDHIGDMREPRHFHQLTVLADGRVAATGGNWYWNDVTGDSPENSCFTTSECDVEVREINHIPCDEDNPCPCELSCADHATAHDSDPTTEPVNTCVPKNNACYATKSAEIWDPETQQWSPCEGEASAAEDDPRMYHSTALLLRDASVISMGGGKVRAIASNSHAR